jgi:hypothetical protein
MTTPTWAELMEMQVDKGSSVPTWKELMEMQQPSVAPPVEGETSFAKGFAEGETFSQQAGDYLGAVTGAAPEISYWNEEEGYHLPRYSSSEELYGDDWNDIGTDERRKRIVALREQRLQEQYGDVEGSTFGNIVGALTDPTSLLPVGATYKGMAAIGGAVGGSYSVADQLLHKGEVDPVEAGGHVIAGAILAPVAGYGFNKIGQAITAKSVKGANQALDDLDVLVSHNIAAYGTAPEQAVEAASQKLGLSPEDLLKASKIANREPKIPTPETAVQMSEKAQEASLASKVVLGISSRIKEFSPRVHHELRKYEVGLLKKTQERQDKAAPFLKALKKYTRNEREKIGQRLMNSDYDGAKALLTRGGRAELNVIKNMVAEDGKLLESQIKDFKSLENYFPRSVKDLEGLRAAIGKKDPEAANGLRKSLKELLEKEGVKNINQLPEEAVTKLVTVAMNKAYPRVLTGHKAHRSVQDVPPELMKFYDDAGSSIVKYIDSSTRSFEKKKFLGVSNLKSGDIDEDAILYKTLGEELRRGRIDDTGFEQIKEMLQARFTKGEEAMTGWVSTVKDIGYMSSLGQFRSAATQLKDIGTAAYLHGIMPTIKGALNFKSTKVHDAGLANTVAAEMNQSGATKKWLDASLSMSGFRAIDRFGKKVLLEASMLKGKKLASSPKGVAVLKKKYGEAYGKDFDQLVYDLKNGVETPDTELYRMHELFDTQPAALSEMPEKYLNHPDGRIAYSLKSFGLKQLTLLHNDIIKKGKTDKVGATKAALKYAAYIGLAGGTVDEAKDFMAGEGFHPEDIPDNVVENLTALFFINKYSIGDLEKGDFGSVIGGWLTPSMAPFTGGMTEIQRQAKGVPIEESQLPINLMKTMPVVGRVLYDWGLGGREKAIKKADQEYMQKLRD